MVRIIAQIQETFEHDNAEEQFTFYVDCWENHDSFSSKFQRSKTCHNVFYITIFLFWHLR